MFRQDKERRSPALDIDGFAWSAKQQAELDELAVATFATGPGKQFLQYLRNVTIEAVNGPNVADEALRHREGARYLVFIIEERLRRGHDRRKNDAH